MTEDQLEQEALSWLVETGYRHVCGYDIAPDGPDAERTDYRQPLLIERLALMQLPAGMTRWASQNNA